MAKGITSHDHSQGQRVDHSTASHNDHERAMNQFGYDVEGGKNIKLSESGGALGTATIGNISYATIYDKSGVQHKLTNREGTTLTFNNDSDARAFVEMQQEGVKSALIEEHRPPSSIDERVRLLRQKQRHAEEIRTGRNIWSAN